MTKHPVRSTPPRRRRTRWRPIGASRLSCCPSPGVGNGKHRPSPNPPLPPQGSASKRLSDPNSLFSGSVSTRRARRDRPQAGRLPRYRKFESGSLQRRVRDAGLGRPAPPGGRRTAQRRRDIQQPVLSTGHVASPRCTTPLQGLILLIFASAPDPCRSSIRSRRCERGRLKRVQPAAEPARDFTAASATPRRAAAMAGERLRAAMRGEG